MNMKEAIKSYETEGYRCSTFDFLGHPCVVVLPGQIYPGAPFIWRTEFFGFFDWADRALLEKGWHLVYAKISDWYGAPHIIDYMEKFYSYVTDRFQLNARADIFGFSRGGLYAMNYAVRNPDTVSTLYLDAPVIDPASWPGGFYQSAPHLEKEWEEACLAYGQSSDELKKDRDRLEEKFEILTEHRIKLLLVAGKQDTEVPYQENGALLEQYYYKKKGSMKVIIKENCGHHPHSLDKPEELIKYIADNMRMIPQAGHISSAGME